MNPPFIIDFSRLGFFHTYVLGLESSNLRIFSNPEMQTLTNPTLYFRAQVRLLKMHPVFIKNDSADQGYIMQLLRLINNLPQQRGFMILGYDKHYPLDGKEDLKRTKFYIPTDYIFFAGRKNLNIFLPFI